MRKHIAISLAVVASVYGVFLYWYGGSSTAMSPSEVDTRLQSVRSVVLAKGNTPDEHLLSGLKALAASDDGREFFMVNLIKFRDKAIYPPELLAQYGDDARDADARYSKAVAPFLIKNGNFPVYLSEVQGRFLHADGATDWDRVAIVRYRSRRDMFEMVEQIASSDLDVGVHKWASIERTEVFPTEAVVGPLQVRLIVLLVLLVLAIPVSVLLGALFRK